MIQTIYGSVLGAFFSSVIVTAVAVAVHADAAITDAETRSSYAQKQGPGVAADGAFFLPEPLPLTLSSSPSDLSPPPDPEPEPFANVPGPDLPQPSQPVQSEPGSQPPSEPQPAEPELTPPVSRPVGPLPSRSRPEAQPAPPTTANQERGSTQSTPEAE
jgi:hypothetical protein